MILAVSTSPSLSTESAMWMPTTWPNTAVFFDSGSSLGRSTNCSTLHSRLIGDSATRGGLTSLLGAGVRPASAISSTSAGSEALVRFIASRRSQVAMLATNSPVSRQLVSVSFGPCGWRPLMPATTTGGFDAMPLKKLNGARLTTPSLLTVVSQPIGRGTTQLLNGSCGSP